MTQAVGISAAIGFIIAFTGVSASLFKPVISQGLPEYTYGLIYMPGVLGVLMTSLIFAKIGAHYAHKLPQERLRKIFAIVLLGLAIKNII
jgi:hypothetical protein